MSVTKAQLQRLVEDLCTLGAAVTELQLSASGALRPLGLDRNHLRSAHDGLLRAAWALNAHLGRFGAGDRNAELASWLAASQASCLEVRKRADRLVEAAISPAAPEALRPSLSELETLMAQMEESTVPLFRLAGFAFSDDLARSLADLMGVDVPPRLAEPAEPVEHAAEEPQEAEYTLCRQERHAQFRVLSPPAVAPRAQGRARDRERWLGQTQLQGRAERGGKEGRQFPIPPAERGVGGGRIRRPPRL